MSTNSTDCCAPTASNDACCDTPTVKKSNSAKSALTIATFVALFLIADYLVPHLLSGRKLLSNAHLQESLIFFATHSVGLMGLLGGITSIAVFARSFINADKVRDHMSKISDLKGHGIAAGIGVATPFCSCSAVPVFTGFVRSGVPVSQAISFLVASPLVNEIAVVMLATWAGWAIAGAYAAAGFLIAIIAGIALKRYAKPELTTVVAPKRSLLTMAMDEPTTVAKLTIGDRLSAATAEARETISKTWIYILIGVGAGAAIHGWVPTSLISKLDSYGPVLGVMVATLIGMPLYSGIATVIPVITALAEKGMPMGTLLAFAMSVTGLSLPEAMLLRSVMKPKLLTLYFTTVAIGIIIVGIGFNLVVR